MVAPTAVPLPTYTPYPTFTPVPIATPTATTQLSPDEAKDRLHSYFELRFSKIDKKFNKFLEERANGGELDISSPHYDPSVLDVVIGFTPEREEWRTRVNSQMIASYEGSQTWVITVTDVSTFLYTGVTGTSPRVTYEEQWWVFEQPGRPPVRTLLTGNVAGPRAGFLCGL